MRGVGEKVEALTRPSAFAPLPAVLVNPRLPLSTQKVFAALGAPPLPANRRQTPPAGTITSTESLLGIMRSCGNDLEAPATALLPVIRGTLPAEDPRSRATMGAVQDELTEDGYVYRFRHDARPLHKSEGAFLLCGFWMAQAAQACGDGDSRSPQ